MVQIQRTVLPPDQNFYVAIQKIFGIGRATGLAVAEACGISKDLKVRDVKEQYVQKVAKYIQENHVVGDQLKRSIRENILSLVNMKSFRGARHELGLPRSKRTHTHTNANTSRIRRYLDLYDTSK